MRLLELKQVCNWIGFTSLELIFLLTASIIFTFFVALKLDNIINISWYYIFGVYFITDGLISYFSIIVFLRQYRLGQYKVAAVRALWKLIQLVTMVAFKILIYSKLDSQKHIAYSEAFTPLYVLLTILVIRTCKVS